MVETSVLSKFEGVLEISLALVGFLFLGHLLSQGLTLSLLSCHLPAGSSPLLFCLDGVALVILLFDFQAIAVAHDKFHGSGGSVGDAIGELLARQHDGYDLLAFPGVDHDIQGLPEASLLLHGSMATLAVCKLF